MMGHVGIGNTQQRRKRAGVIVQHERMLETKHLTGGDCGIIGGIKTGLCDIIVGAVKGIRWLSRAKKFTRHQNPRPDSTSIVDNFFYCGPPEGLGTLNLLGFGSRDFSFFP
jgi:hypothetical protein